MLKCGCIPGSFLCPKAVQLWEFANEQHRLYALAHSESLWAEYRKAFQIYRDHLEVNMNHCANCGYSDVEVGGICPVCRAEDLLDDHDEDYPSEYLTISVEDPCHEWEEIWDDQVGQRCCVCMICGDEKIFQYDVDEVNNE
jgi:hypothetical protein